MTDIYDLFDFEEDWRDKPYIDTEGYPTVGFGFKIGPKGAPLSNYVFTLPRTAGEVWLRCYLDTMVADITGYPEVDKTLRSLRSRATGADYSDARICVLLSMCYQMGISGVDQFRNTLRFMQVGDFTKAAVNMLASKWGRQTGNRAARHAKQMQTGHWASEYV